MHIGILHPGQMGAAVGAALVDCGHDVRWVAAGRSPASRERASAARLHAVADLAALREDCELVLSICPPDAAGDVAATMRGHAGTFVDANAIAPSTAREVQSIVGGRCVDGSIIGPPPTSAGTTRLYLSGPGAHDVARVFDGARIEARALDDGDAVAASALKMAYAAWTKGSQALLLAAAGAAQQLGVADALAAEWQLSAPQLVQRLERARAAAQAKGWRWEGEMREIASTFAAAGEPSGFHEAAAEVFGRPSPAAADTATGSGHDHPPGMTSCPR